MHIAKEARRSEENTSKRGLQVFAAGH